MRITVTKTQKTFTVTVVGSDAEAQAQKIKAYLTNEGVVFFFKRWVFSDLDPAICIREAAAA